MVFYFDIVRKIYIDMFFFIFIKNKCSPTDTVCWKISKVRRENVETYSQYERSRKIKKTRKCRRRPVDYRIRYTRKTRNRRDIVLVNFLMDVSQEIVEIYRRKKIVILKVA